MKNLFLNEICSLEACPGLLLIDSFMEQDGKVDDETLSQIDHYFEDCEFCQEYFMERTKEVHDKIRTEFRDQY